jgi:2-polyprenyl-3-methyl-5-hydroxy-6-metoxy-1,4-benzoquinol methylase
MKLNYVNKIIDQNIDIKKLRPNNSYDNLIEKRTYGLENLIEDNRIPQKYLENRACPSCGFIILSGEGSAFEFYKDYFYGVSCTNCNLVFINPVLNSEIYEKLYKSEIYQDIVKTLGEDSHAYRKEKFGKERIDLVEEFHKSTLSKNLLDIGCSTGFVIEEADDRGWLATGIELNPSAVSFGRSKGLFIIDKPIEDIDFTDVKYSDILLYDVLEHLINPSKMINKIYDLLLDDGMLHIYVPNYNSAILHLLGNANTHFIWPTHHLNYYTPETLKYFLEKHGFKIEHWETQGLDIDDWLWYLENKTDYDTNLVRNNKKFFQFVINSSGYGVNLRMYVRKIPITERSN